MELLKLSYHGKLQRIIWNHCVEIKVEFLLL